TITPGFPGSATLSTSSVKRSSPPMYSPVRTFADVSTTSDISTTTSPCVKDSMHANQTRGRFQRAPSGRGWQDRLQNSHESRMQYRVRVTLESANRGRGGDGAAVSRCPEASRPASGRTQRERNGG